MGPESEANDTTMRTGTNRHRNTPGSQSEVDRKRIKMFSDSDAWASLTDTPGEAKNKHDISTPRPPRHTVFNTAAKPVEPEGRTPWESTDSIRGLELLPVAQFIRSAGSEPLGVLKAAEVKNDADGIAVVNRTNTPEAAKCRSGGRLALITPGVLNNDLDELGISADKYQEVKVLLLDCTVWRRGGNRKCQANS